MHVTVREPLNGFSLNLILESFAIILRHAPGLFNAIGLGYNVAKGTEYFVSL